jgi:hypothetical protein
MPPSNKRLTEHGRATVVARVKRLLPHLKGTFRIDYHSSTDRPTDDDDQLPRDLSSSGEGGKLRAANYPVTPLTTINRSHMSHTLTHWFVFVVVHRTRSVWCYLRTRPGKLEWKILTGRRKKGGIGFLNSRLQYVFSHPRPNPPKLLALRVHVIL